MDIDCISSIKRLCLTACLFSSSLKFTCALWPKKYQEPEETGRVHKNPRESVKLLTTIISFVCVKFDERRIWNLTTKINFFFFFITKRSFLQGQKKEVTYSSFMYTASVRLVTYMRNNNKSHKWTTLWTGLFKRILPATKHNDRTVCGCQLLFQLSDHDGVVSQGLLHCQQADLRDVEGVFAKRQRFAIVPLKEGEGGWRGLSLVRYPEEMQTVSKLQGRTSPVLSKWL